MLLSADSLFVDPLGSLLCPLPIVTVHLDECGSAKRLEEDELCLGGCTHYLFAPLNLICGYLVVTLIFQLYAVPLQIKRK